MTSKILHFFMMLLNVYFKLKKLRVHLWDNRRIKNMRSIALYGLERKFCYNC